MKASDTVMSNEEIRELYLGGRLSIVRDALLKQAEISFKAGLQEVVKWIESHQLIEPKLQSTTRFEPFYHIEQQELKKWEIEC